MRSLLCAARTLGYTLKKIPGKEGGLAPAPIGYTLKKIPGKEGGLAPAEIGYTLKKIPGKEDGLAPALGREWSKISPVVSGSLIRNIASACKVFKAPCCLRFIEGCSRRMALQSVADRSGGKPTFLTWNLLPMSRRPTARTSPPSLPGIFFPGPVDHSEDKPPTPPPASVGGSFKSSLQTKATQLTRTQANPHRYSISAGSQEYSVHA